MTFTERGESGTGDGFEDRDYKRAGLDASTAKGWRRWGIEPIDAARWIQLGVTEPVTAAQWRTAAVKPADVTAWVDAGITSSEAVQWHEFGVGQEQAFTEHAAGKKPMDFHAKASDAINPKMFRGRGALRGLRAVALGSAVEDSIADPVEFFAKSGVFATAAMSYLQIGWFDEVAALWAAAEIDALDARDWLELGFTPDEAARAERAGMGAAPLLMCWARAGIPVDEIAEWCGAGLTPAEAVAQRASGVTVEQAAVMRSLRQHDE